VILALILTALPHLTLPSEPVPAWATGSGRVYTSATLHVGIRPAVYITNDGPELAAGATVQITTVLL
jgi:hypothetical protein